MGEFVSCLMNVSHGYDTYLFAICNRYGSEAEQILEELFERLAEDIGPKSVIIKPMNNGVREAEQLFEIDYQKRRPVLVITDCHPMKLIKYRQMVDNNPNVDRDLREIRFRESAFYHPELLEKNYMRRSSKREIERIENSGGNAITIELGSISDGDRLRHFLYKLSELLQRGDFHRVRIEHSKEMIVSLLEHVGIAGLAVSIVSLFK